VKENKPMSRVHELNRACVHLCNRAAGLEMVCLLDFYKCSGNTALLMILYPLWKVICRSLKKLKIELPYNAVTPLLGIY
jgi:hypothetical protein